MDTPGGGEQADALSSALAEQLSLASVRSAGTGFVIGNFHVLGVPVITPAGNDRQSRPGNPTPWDQVGFWPRNQASRDFPLIVVGETDFDRKRGKNSQAGPQVTTWAYTEDIFVTFKDGSSDDTGCTSLGAGLVAGAIAIWDSCDEADRPWGNRIGIERVTAIGDFLKHDPKSGWARTDSSGKPTSERVLWNGATKEDHDKAGGQTAVENSPPEVPKVKCNGLETRKYNRRDHFVAQFDAMCQSVIRAPTSAQSSIIEREDFQETLGWVKFYFAYEKSAGPRTMEQCLEGYRRILDDCDQDPKSVDNMNWKAGGELKIDKVTYAIAPQKYREPWVEKSTAGCHVNGFIHDDHSEAAIEIFRRGWQGVNLGERFKTHFGGQIHYGHDIQYGTDPLDHREWTLRVNPRFRATEVGRDRYEGWIHKAMNWDRIPREKVTCSLT